LGGDYHFCEQDVLAAWLLKHRGQEAREAVPALIDKVSSWAGESNSFSPFAATIKSKYPADWFAATLTSVDPEGKEAIPLLIKAFKKAKTYGEIYDDRQRIVRAIGLYGAKAKSAIPFLQDVVKNPGSEAASSWGSSMGSMSSGLMGWAQEAVAKKPSTLQDIAAETIKKIDPNPAIPKPPKKGKQN
jgi:hypothetical protein